MDDNEAFRRYEQRQKKAWQQYRQKAAEKPHLDAMYHALYCHELKFAFLDYLEECKKLNKR
jgi:hypothetical protein